MVNILTGEMLVSGGHLPRRLWLDVPKGFHFTECDSDPIGAETAWPKPRGVSFRTVSVNVKVWVRHG